MVGLRKKLNKGSNRPWPVLSTETTGRMHKCCSVMVTGATRWPSNNTEHEDNLVTDLFAPKQVVSTVSSIGVNNSIETKTRKWHAKGRHVTGQRTNTLSRKLKSDLTVDYQVHNWRVSNAYNIPVTNQFQLLDADQEIQVSTDNGVCDHTVVHQRVCKGIMSHATLDNESNIYHTSLVADSTQTHNSDTVQHDPDPDSTQLNIIDANPDLVPEYHKCKAQIGTKFDCIPLAPIYVYKGEPKIWGTVPDVLMAHRLIRNTGIHNFWGYISQSIPI